MKKASLRFNEGVSFFASPRFQLTRYSLVTHRPTIPYLTSVRNSPPFGGVGGGFLNHTFVCNQYYSRPSPFGEGMGVRLLVDESKAVKWV